MTREEMIQELSKIIVAAAPTIMTMDMGLEFDYITAKGAGSILGTIGEWPAYKFHVIDAEKWQEIRSKLKDGTIEEQDFNGTDIERLIRYLHSIYGDLYDQFYKDVTATYAGMLELPEKINGPFFCLLDVRAWGEKPAFFGDEQSLKEEFRDRYCCDITEWKDMDEEEIRNWYERLSCDLGGLVIMDYTDSDEENDNMDDMIETELNSKASHKLSREEMLDKLHSVEFQYLWPGDWKDIGFTEREIWVNSKGYGYLSCDEPNGSCWYGDGLSKSEWLRIKEKLENETLEFSDFQGTCLENALNELYVCGYDPDDDYSEPNKVLKTLLDLRNGAVGKLYACLEEDGPVFFDNEEEFRKFYERDWCDYAWDELEDDILEKWVERLVPGADMD